MLSCLKQFLLCSGTWQRSWTKGISIPLAWFLLNISSYLTRYCDLICLVSAFSSSSPLVCSLGMGNVSYVAHISSVFSTIQEIRWPVAKLGGYLITIITAHAPEQHMWPSIGSQCRSLHIFLTLWFFFFATVLAANYEPLQCIQNHIRDWTQSFAHSLLDWQCFSAEIWADTCFLKRS